MNNGTVCSLHYRILEMVGKMNRVRIFSAFKTGCFDSMLVSCYLPPKRFNRLPVPFLVVAFLGVMMGVVFKLLSHVVVTPRRVLELRYE